MEGHVTPPEFFQITAADEITACEQRRELHFIGTNSLRVEMLLTPRQLHALQLTAQGMKDAEAAHVMRIRRSAFNRLKNRAESKVRWLEDFFKKNAMRPASLRQALGIT
jgi:hypothetical protein